MQSPMKRIGIDDDKVRVARFGNGDVAIVRKIDNGMYRVLSIKNGRRIKRDIPSTDWAWLLMQPAPYGVRYMGSIEQEGFIDALRDIWTAATTKMTPKGSL